MQRNVILRFGRKGEQLATVVRFTSSGRYVVRKWRRNSASWTGDVYIMPGEILRDATADESAWVGKDLAKFVRAADRYLAKQNPGPDCNGDPKCKAHQGGKYDLEGNLECRV